MLKRLTERQRDTFNVIVKHPKRTGGTLRKWAKFLGVTHVAVADRIELMVKKGYVERVEGEHNFDKERGYVPTSEGLEQMMKDRRNDRFIRVRR